MADEIGRPTKYDPKFCKQAKKLSLLGATDKEMADFFEVSEQTLNTWKKEHPEFLESLKEGKDMADAQVVKSLFKRACGYSHPEDKVFVSKGETIIVPTIKHYPPDTLACVYWLNNRQRAKWSNRQVIEVDENYTAPEPKVIQFIPAKTA